MCVPRGRGLPPLAAVIYHQVKKRAIVCCDLCVCGPTRHALISQASHKWSPPTHTFTHTLTAISQRTAAAAAATVSSHLIGLPVPLPLDPWNFTCQRFWWRCWFWFPFWFRISDARYALIKLTCEKQHALKIPNELMALVFLVFQVYVCIINTR